MSLFDKPITLDSLAARIAVLEAALLDKPARQSTEVPPEIRQAWSLWTLHKSGCKGWTAVAKQRQIAKLSSLSGNDEALALRIVEEAIERGWTTFFMPKDLPTSGKPIKPVREVLKQQESSLERAIGYANQQYRFHGNIEERDRQIAEATQRHRRQA